MGGGDTEVVGGGGRDGEFAPEAVDVRLGVVHAGEFHEVVPDGGVGPIGAD